MPKNKINIEMIKERLKQHNQADAISIIEELQGYPLWSCRIRERAQGCFKDEEYKEHRKTLCVQTYVRAKSKKEAYSKVKERYMNGEYGFRFQNAYCCFDSHDLDRYGRLTIDVEKII